MHDSWLLNYTLAFAFPEHGADLTDDVPGNPTILRYERKSGWSIVSKGIGSQD